MICVEFPEYTLFFSFSGHLLMATAFHASWRVLSGQTEQHETSLRYKVSSSSDSSCKTTANKLLLAKLLQTFSS